MSAQTKWLLVTLGLTVGLVGGWATNHFFGHPLGLVLALLWWPMRWLAERGDAILARRKEGRAYDQYQLNTAASPDDNPRSGLRRSEK
jgi:hypothetical protein